MPLELHAYGWADLWHPGVLAWVALLQAVYLLAVGPWRQAFGWGPPVPAWRQLLFSAGLWLIYLAEGTPVHVLSERYLFSVHMVQHLLLTTAMPPLLLVGAPGWLVAPLFARGPVAGLVRWLTRPLPALLIFNLILALWHLPVAYEAALKWHGFHMVQHAILVSTALVMWWPVAAPEGPWPRMHESFQMGYLFLVGLTQIATFGMITFADHPIYGFYAAAPRLWSIDPMSDQQLAGILMKYGMMGAITVVWGILFYRWASREGPAQELKQGTEV